MTVELRISVAGELSDALVAELADLGFVAFSREHGTTVAWGPAGPLTADAEPTIRAWLSRHSPGSTIQTRNWPDQNWNAAWEASIEPVVAGPFVILPSWAVIPEEHRNRVPLRIDPKMSFGTGHHASTRLALELLAGRVAHADRVLDVGCGTGVLALGALKLGAGLAIGCDIDVWSVPNARECATLNDLAERFDVREGGLEVVPEERFALVVANIIRSTLLEILSVLAAKLAPRGHLVLAGLLEHERDEMVEAALALGLTMVEETREDGWWAGAFTEGPGLAASGQQPVSRWIG